MTASETGDDGNGAGEGKKVERLLPIDYIWLKYAFYTAIIVWSIYLLDEATSWSRLEDYLVPYLTLSLLILLSALRIVQIRFPLFQYVIEQFSPEVEHDDRTLDEDDELVGARAKYEKVTEGSEMTPQQEKRMLLGIAWVLILPPTVYVLGFVVGFPLYVFVFSYFYLRNVKKATLVTGVFLVSMYLLFIYLLKAPIYEGLLDIPVPF